MKKFLDLFFRIVIVEFFILRDGENEIKKPLFI